MKTQEKITIKKKPFNKAAFKKEIIDNVKVLFRKTIDEASQQEIFQAVSLAAKDIIIDPVSYTHLTLPTNSRV